MVMETSILGWGDWLALMSVWNFLYFALCTPAGVLSSKASKLPLSLPVRGFPSTQKLFLFQSFHLDSFVSLFCFIFPFYLPFYLSFLEVWGLLPAFKMCSIGIIPHVEVFFMYLLYGRQSPHLTPRPFWSLPTLQDIFWSWRSNWENLPIDLM